MATQSRLAAYAQQGSRHRIPLPQGRSRLSLFWQSRLLTVLWFIQVIHGTYSMNSIYIFTHVYTSMYMYMYMYMYIYIYIHMWITTQLFKWDVRDVYSTWTHGWRNHLWFQAPVMRGYSSSMVSTLGLTIGAVSSTKSITPGLLIIGSAI